MSTLFVDTINEKTSGNGIKIPGHVVQVVSTTNTDTQTITHSTSSTLTGLSGQSHLNLHLVRFMIYKCTLVLINWNVLQNNVEVRLLLANCRLTKILL